MKRILISILFLFVLSSPLFAQQKVVPYTQLPDGGTLQSTDILNVARCNHSGCNFQVKPGPAASAQFPLSVPNGGTGQSNPSLLAGPNLSVNGSWPDQTVSFFPPGTTNDLLINQGGNMIGGIGLGTGLAISGGLVVTTGSSTSAPAGVYPQLQYNDQGTAGGLSTNTLASYENYNVLQNGLALDPRDPTYGAICHNRDTFSGNGSTITFNYDIPFTGSNSTDNTSFYVYYQPTSGNAVILTTSQFSVTGVNSGVGGTITFNTAPPAGSTVYVLHDDTTGLEAAMTASVASGGYVNVPDDCWVRNVIPVNGAVLIGNGYSPNYGDNNTFQKPIMHIIDPLGSTNTFGFNIDNVQQLSLIAFELLGDPDGPYDNSTCVGTFNSGAGNATAPGIVLEHMDIKYCTVGFGNQLGNSNSGYIFAVSRFNNYSDNQYGIRGAFSDFKSINDDVVTGYTAAMYFGPNLANGAPAVGGMIANARIEFNGYGIVFDGAQIFNIDGTQFDGNTKCSVRLQNTWNNINITGGWMHYSANGGYPGFPGNTASGQDAHICFAGTGSASGFHMSNVNMFIGGSGPLGSSNAASPPYALDFVTAGTSNEDISITGGSINNSASNNGAYVTDFAIFRNGRPTKYKVDVTGQPVQGENASGSIPSQSRGLPSSSWSALYVVGSYDSYNDGYDPLSNGYAGIVGKNLGVGPTYAGINDNRHTDCDVVNLAIFPNLNPENQNNPAYTWLPSQSEPFFGGGFYQGHLTDTTACYMAGLSWLSIPQQYKIYAQTSGFTTTGTWANSNAYGGAYGITSSTNLSTASGTITTNGGPIYLWYHMNGNNGGTFTYSLDGGPAIATVLTQGQNAWDFPQTSASFTVGAVRIPVVGSGSHVIHVNVTSSTSASNTVTILGIGTPSNLPYAAGGPSVFFAGTVPNTTYPAAATAFNQAQFQTAKQMSADGMSVNFVDINPLFNINTDIIPIGGGFFFFTSTGQGHFADAFSGAMQGTRMASQSVNPLDYGAACNTHIFIGGHFESAPIDNTLTATAGSPVISILNYTFQDGNATPNGGGDVGKQVSLTCQTDEGPTTYIQSVDTVHNTATLGRNMPTNCGPSATSSIVVMGGYPSNPNNPATAQDDTFAIQAASYAAQIGGGFVSLPNHCLVHNLQLANNTKLQGSNGGTDYNGDQYSPYPSATVLYTGMTGFADDIDPTNGGVNNLAINTENTINVELADFTLEGPNFPYLGFPGIGSACVGVRDLPSGTQGFGLDPENIKLNHLSVWHCPVAFNIPFAWNQPVVFQGYIAGNTLTVTAITSSNLAVYKKEGELPALTDFLSVSRPFTGSGVASTSFTASQSGNTLTVTAVGSGTLAMYQPIAGGGVNSDTHIIGFVSGTMGGPGVYTVNYSAFISSETMTGGTIITSSPPGGGLGTYTVNNTQTVGSSGSPVTFTSAAPSVGQSGSILESQFSSDGMGINGDLSDFVMKNSIFTGVYHYGWFDGPSTVSYGSTGGRVLGGRFEETGIGYFADGTFNNQFTGVQWDRNKYASIYILNSQNIMFVGNFFHASNTFGSGAGVAQIVLGTGAVGVSVIADAAAPADGTPYFIGTDVGATGVDYVSVEGGILYTSSSTAFVNWKGNTPQHYKQYTMGLPIIDTTQSTLSMSAAGLVGVGTSVAANQLDVYGNVAIGTSYAGVRTAPTNGLSVQGAVSIGSSNAQSGVALDMGANTTSSNSAIALPIGTTGARPASPASGWMRFNSTLGKLELFYSGVWNSLAPLVPQVPTAGAIYGLGLSNDIVTPNTIIDISPGSATSDDGLTTMLLPGFFTKTTGSFVVGSGNGCLDSGTVASTTWYNMFEMERTDTGLVDILCSTSLLSPTLPASYTEDRWLGAFETDGSAHILPFKQTGGDFSWSTGKLDMNGVTIGTSATAETLSVPPGVNAQVYGHYSFVGTGTTGLQFSSPDTSPGAPTTTVPFSASPGFNGLYSTTGAGTINANLPYLVTNTSGQVNVVSTAGSTTVSEITDGYRVSLSSALPLKPTINISFMNGTLPAGIVFTRSSVGWYFNSSGLLVSAAANAPRFDYGTPGSSTLVGLLTEGPNTNLALWSRDLTQTSAWTATTSTVALDQTGIDGVASSASSITATANNATVCQIITPTVNVNTEFSVYLKRITGTGTISIANNGSTYVTESITGSWVRYFNNASTTTPQICIKLATSGDKIAVDVIQYEQDPTRITLSSPIVTTTAAVTRTAESVTMPTPWYSAGAGSYVYQFEANNAGALVGNYFSFGSSVYQVNVNNGNFSIAGDSIFGISYNTPLFVGVSYSAPGGVFSTVYNGVSKGAGSSLASAQTTATFGGQLYSWARGFQYWAYPLTTSQLITVAP